MNVHMGNLGLIAVPSIAAGASLLYSDQPALKWEDALISGNGEQGILVFGDLRQERIIFNHEFLYEYIGAENVAPADISDVMGQVKQMIKAGRYEEARELTLKRARKKGTSEFCGRIHITRLVPC